MRRTALLSAGLALLVAGVVPASFAETPATSSFVDTARQDWQPVDADRTSAGRVQMRAPGATADGRASRDDWQEDGWTKVDSAPDEDGQASWAATSAPVRPEVIEFGADGSGNDENTSPGAPDSVSGQAGPVQPRSTPDDKVDMFAGEVRVFGKVDVTRVAIGNGDVIRAEILSTGELLIIAQAPGSTSMRLWNTDDTQTGYNIRVSETDPVTRVRMERMVRMRVRLVEFRRSALGELGISWGDSTTGPTFAAAGDAIGSNLFRPASDGFDGLPNRVAPFSTYFGIASNITSRINFMASNGDAVTLAEPVLSAVNGGEASFLAGGEVPYPSIGPDGQPVVDFKEYGIKLDVMPVIDDAGNVRASVATEISQIDNAVSVGDAPGLLTRRAQTEVNVRSGETIVISGLLSAETAESVDRVPGLGRLPILGSLFRSNDTRKSVSELVIFVTPEVIEPADAGARGRDLETLTRTTNEFDQATEWLDTARPSFME